MYLHVFQGGTPIFNIFKCGMSVEIQDKEYPYRVWISKVQSIL